MNLALVADLIGTMAAVCTTAAFIPQAILVYKTRDTKSISLPMYIVFNIGVICWAVYGFLIQATPIFSANIITFIFAFYILLMKINGNKSRK